MAENDSEVKRRTGFKSLNHLLAFVVIVCNGDHDVMIYKKQSLPGWKNGSSPLNTCGVEQSHDGGMLKLRWRFIDHPLRPSFMTNLKESKLAVIAGLAMRATVKTSP